MKTNRLWGALWYSRNSVDGVTRHLVCKNYIPVLFYTRQRAREWIAQTFGYIKHRRDLRTEPHGWTVPRAVRVMLKVEEGR